jgi:5-formyltetrahydrofolate cyclo-ligase
LTTQTDFLTDQKERLRRGASARRAAAHADRAATAGQALADLFVGALAQRLPGATVSLFWPMRDEIDVRVLFSSLAAGGVRTALPVMAGAGEPLAFRAWAPGDALVGAPFGVSEPAEDAPAAAPDIVGVPLLAFDARGNRLGYGGGYYDRTLRALRASGDILAVGICYDEQEFPELPHHAGDEALDMIITDRRSVLAAS